MYRYPSGPNATMPPLWLAAGCGMRSRTRSDRRVRQPGVRRGAVLGDHGRPVRGAGVVDEEPPVGGVVGMKCQSQQPAFATERDARADVEERGGRHRAVGAHDPDHATLLDDEQAARPVARVGDRDAAW